MRAINEGEVHVPVQTEFTARVQEKNEFVTRSCSRLNSGLCLAVSCDNVQTAAIPVPS